MVFAALGDPPVEVGPADEYQLAVIVLPPKVMNRQTQAKQTEGEPAETSPEVVRVGLVEGYRLREQLAAETANLKGAFWAAHPVEKERPFQVAQAVAQRV